MNNANLNTRRIVITKKYESLIKKLSELPYFDADLFPSLENLDIVNLLFFTGFIFTNASDDYKSDLQNILKLKNKVLTEEQFEEASKIVLPFIQWIKNYT